eukprot:CAMPEP_0178421674 /NCGR_PEP_ID=MMETSP0689_2-20121128/26769_1 /TAXON_ID=160604 /ORGANISM="Amphidinium massartii, Strain CS-259" /LENGTH=231 /DNA_ID=CAMNT_0020043193 /DNA_START=69 /DNA_END=764 /DNA_ORIENTATION=+
MSQARRLLLTVAAAFSAHAAAAEGTPRPLFDLLFAANCPTCRAYGNSTLKEIWAADGIAEALDWKLEIAIRHGKDGNYECVAEAPGCPITRFVQCAFDTKEASIAKKMAYMMCWNRLPMRFPGDAEIDSTAEACAEEAKLPWKDIVSCNQSARVDELNEASFVSFKRQFPKNAQPGYPHFGVPHVYIDGEELGPDGWAEKVDFPTLLKKLCDKGIDAEACKQVQGTVNLVV